MEAQPRQVFPSIFNPISPSFRFNFFLRRGRNTPFIDFLTMNAHDMSNLSLSSPRSSPPSSQPCALLRHPVPHRAPPSSPVQSSPAPPSSSWHSRRYSAYKGVDDGASATGRSPVPSVYHLAPPYRGKKWTCHFRVRLLSPWTHRTLFRPIARTATAVWPVASAPMMVAMAVRPFMIIFHFRVRSPRPRMHVRTSPYPYPCNHPPHHSHPHDCYALAPRNRGPYSKRASGHRRQPPRSSWIHSHIPLGA